MLFGTPFYNLLILDATGLFKASKSAYVIFYICIGLTIITSVFFIIASMFTKVYFETSFAGFKLVILPSLLVLPVGMSMLMFKLGLSWIFIICQSSLRVPLQLLQLFHLLDYDMVLLYDFGVLIYDSMYSSNSVTYFLSFIAFGILNIVLVLHSKYGPSSVFTLFLELNGEYALNPELFLTSLVTSPSFRVLIVLVYVIIVFLPIFQLQIGVNKVKEPSKVPPLLNLLPIVML